MDLPILILGIYDEAIKSYHSAMRIAIEYTG